MIPFYIMLPAQYRFQPYSPPAAGITRRINKTGSRCSRSVHRVYCGAGVRVTVKFASVTPVITFVLIADEVVTVMAYLRLL